MDKACIAVGDIDSFLEGGMGRIAQDIVVGRMVVDIGDRGEQEEQEL
jgi:hypothetical protein